MKKTIKKVAEKKATAPKRIIKEETPKTPVAKKSARIKKVEEAPREVIKKPVRKKEVTHKKVVAEIKPKVKAEVVKPEAKEVIKKVEVPKPVPVMEPVVKPRAPKVIVRRPATLAQGVGRRKEAVARVWLKLGSGKLLINGHAYDRYFGTQISRLSATMPFRVINKAQNYDVFANVIGGGVCAQADAVKLGFVRALLQLNEQWRPELRKAGLLTVDSRQKERKKYGQRGARRKFQFVKR